MCLLKKKEELQGLGGSRLARPAPCARPSPPPARRRVGAPAEFAEVYSEPAPASWRPSHTAAAVLALRVGPLPPGPAQVRVADARTGADAAAPPAPGRTAWPGSGLRARPRGARDPGCGAAREPALPARRGGGGGTGDPAPPGPRRHSPGSGDDVLLKLLIAGGCGAPAGPRAQEPAGRWRGSRGLLRALSGGEEAAPVSRPSGAGRGEGLWPEIRRLHLFFSADLAGGVSTLFFFFF